MKTLYLTSILFLFTVLPVTVQTIVKPMNKQIVKPKINRKQKELHNLVKKQREEEQKKQEEQRKLQEANVWLHSINYKYTIERMKAMKRLRLQMYGSFNGISTQTLISNENLKHLKVLTSLEILALPTWTNDQGLSNVAGLTNLTSLNIPKTRITDAGMVHLKNLTRLNSLVIAGGSIGNQSMQYIAAMKHLTILNLTGTKIDDNGLKQLEGLQNIQKLFLNRTNITDSSIPSLLKMTNLQRIDITGTKITAEGRQRLKTAFPNLKIY